MLKQIFEEQILHSVRDDLADKLDVYWQGFADIVEEIESLKDEAHAMETIKRVLEIARAGMQGTLTL